MKIFQTLKKRNMHSKNAGLFQPKFGLKQPSIV